MDRPRVQGSSPQNTQVHPLSNVDIAAPAAGRRRDLDSARVWKLRIILAPQNRPLTSCHGPFGAHAGCQEARAVQGSGVEVAAEIGGSLLEKEAWD